MSRAMWRTTAHNPWHLTDRQAQAMDAMTRIGSRSDVARAWGVERTTVNYLVREATRKIGVENEILALLERDRMRKKPVTFNAPRPMSSVFDWRAGA